MKNYKINSKLSVNIFDLLMILGCNRWDDYLIPSLVTKNEESQYI